VTPTGQIDIRNGLNGAVVVDGTVCGGTTCSGGPSYFDVWGVTSTPGSYNYAYFNIQNQTDVADWPCYSKAYIVFPLGSIPAGKKIISAQLILHQFGNSGGGSWGDPPSSLIQVMTVSGSWTESSLTWNNAPLVKENVSRLWVDPVSSFPGWPGAAHTWDLSQAVIDSYNAHQPLSLAIYSADEAYHTGKYFSSSDTEDWNSAARPTLHIVYGNP
jgi:hypothetical protein